jgi:phenylacetate-coenzyme A ligase PaaK-like adenylate-forming protein
MNHNHRFPPEYYQNSLEVLETSLGRLGAYRSWQAFDPGASYHIDQRYAALPALTKRDIREYFPQGFVPAGRDVEQGLGSGEIQIVSTSGSSDAIRVSNIWNQSWWDASERASWKLNSHAARLTTGNHPEAILANARNVGVISDEADLPFEKRRLSRFLYLNEKTNPAAWSPQLMDRMINELNIFKPAILEANPSLLAKLCRYAATKPGKVFQPGLIIFTYEYPSLLHYRQIRRVFTAPTASSYGTTETGYVFMQCEAGKLHQNSESCRVDIQPLKPTHGGPQVGRILVTTFKNPWYYMLRFDVGDLIRLDNTQKCTCGRDSGLIASAIEGRFINATLTCDGQLVTLHSLDEALNVLEGIDEYRLEQRSPGVYALYLASQRQNKDSLEKEAKAILRKLYGKAAAISIIHQDFLTPDDSGKYSLARTLFPLDIKDYLDTPGGQGIE